MHFRFKPPGIRFWAAALALVILYAGGLAIRRALLEGQLKAAGFGAETPFTLESALAFARVRTVFFTGTLPERDPTIQFPEGIDLRRTYNVGAEYVYAALARLLPNDMSLACRLRWIAAAWFCLGIPAMALWAWLNRPSVWAAAAAGAFYAVSLGAALRSTGQELSDENFAIPLLLWHLAADAWAARSPSTRDAWLRAAVSAALLACALMTWDLIQFYVALWAARGFVLLAAGNPHASAHERWTLGFAALAVAAAFNPYLRAHCFWGSPVMLLAAGTAVGFVLQGTGALRGLNAAARRAITAAIALAPAIAGAAFNTGYAEKYGHFARLLKAKIMFLNSKPADPALLDFEQRILWTPALNSVNLRLTFELFPVILPLALLGVLFLCIDRLRGADSDSGWLGAYVCISLAAFFLFMRFQVFFAVFACACIGRLIARMWEARRTAPAVLASALVAYGVAAETDNTLARPQRWGRDYYYEESMRLSQWFVENTGCEPVLANFGLSAFLSAYAGTPIILHPKFENPEIRRRVREYGEALFKGGEEAFRDWAEKFGAAYYVHSLGEFSDFRPDLQMRYFVDALNPPQDAAARIFEYEPRKARYFHMLYSSPKYRVFRIITRRNQAEALAMAESARKALENGEFEKAEEMLKLALVYDPKCDAALELSGRGQRPAPAPPAGEAAGGER